MEKYAVIVAGGSGIRMGGQLPKQFILLKNKPVLWYTLTTFLNAFSDLQIILVVPAVFMDKGKEIMLTTHDPSRIKITEGGQTRFHSVRNGLKYVPEQSVVFVHDGVRCLVTTELIHRCYDGVMNKGNAIPAISPTDTIRIEMLSGNEMMDRNKVKLIQTPQAFSGDIIKSAFEQDYQESFTDEASVVEKYDIKIHLIEGEITNIKITKPIDILIAEKILEERYPGADR